jgi:hypothetical protein
VGVAAYDIDATKVSMSAGAHTIHFKSWTTKGICLVANTTFNTNSPSIPPPPPVITPPVTVPGLILSDAIASANLDTSTRWAGEQDAGMPGSARGSTVYPATTPSGDEAREFYMTYSSRGGVRWHVSFARDENATHFVSTSSWMELLRMAGPSPPTSIS